MSVGRGHEILSGPAAFCVYYNLCTAKCVYMRCNTGTLQLVSPHEMLDTARDFGEDDGSYYETTAKQDVLSLVTDATAMCMLFCVILYVVACTVLLMTVDATSALFM